MFISFAYQNLAVLCVKRMSFFLEILMLYEVYTQHGADWNSQGKSYYDEQRPYRINAASHVVAAILAYVAHSVR